MQKINAVEGLKVLLLECRNETINRFLPCVKESLENGNEELHIVSSKVFCDVTESEVLPGAVYAKYLLPIVLENIRNENVGK